MEDSREAILRQLQENRGRFVSGEELAGRLNISRAAVWKHIRHLRREGYQIEALPRRGYLLEEEPDRLDASLLTAEKLFYYTTVDSTNAVLRRMAEEGAPHETMVIAEEQRAGRGRRGRRWLSPPGKGLYFSLLLRPAGVAPEEAAPITLAAAVALAQQLQRETGLPVRVKWPNDLLVNHRKIGGILTELKGEPDRVEYLVMGIGINVNQEHSDLEELAGRASSLYLEKGEKFPRTPLFLGLRSKLLQGCRQFFLEGFAPFRLSWRQLNATLGRRVTVSWAGGSQEGLAVDLDEQGALLLEDDRGKRHRFTYGEII
ncbi:MAG: biotin--[acetyl-CoA-carboxylase] ligase [Dethiobacteria bacterium]|nr:biotin--[acetyl-CoA-carboxylase] ligase [Bacillota bacterium]HOP69383.1 biotin--[acetyl-CoA-carboxylase] ligase [Bacillota bacterium]HPT33210.1 biotin--[acetyl-CoA-carboxylase] ligase [Bacillota bacterium]HPZ64565.1 biotin--[acetyl-CoA-carboxylase] ligase [Bacillota bacterium]HQD05603.1 biotin--[acetyl-CoA-carboxylase] ligase [Bacillota bacterium]